MGKKRVEQLLSGKPGLIKGELWIAPEILQLFRLEKKQRSLIKMAEIIGSDFCFFSFKSPIEDISTDSKKMFQLCEEAHKKNLGCGITIDGPFERIVNNYGFINAMNSLSNIKNFKNMLMNYFDKIQVELQQASDAGADMMILCDDIGYNAGLYLSPKLFKELIVPIYQELIGHMSNKIGLGFHSDGNIENILPILIEIGFKIFSLEAEAMDLVRLKKEILSQSIIMSGIKAKWLFDKEWVMSGKEDVLLYLQNLYGENGLILSSTCGLYHESNIDQLKQLYNFLYD